MAKREHTQTQTQAETALLVGVLLPGMERNGLECQLEELEKLTRSAGAAVEDVFVVPRDRIDPGAYIGKGKREEIAAFIVENAVSMVIFNNELSPRQAANLMDVFKVKVLDRTELILDIFARRAQTQEGKLQVEIAQLQYMLPRLVGCWTHLSRQNGRIGTRGPGETQLEVDRRRINARIRKLSDSLAEVRRHRETQRKARRRQDKLRTVAVAGYTNAGKSTLLRAMTGVDTLVADQLFATLDPLAKRVPIKDLPNIVLIDTVGFLRALPHGIVDAFKATLDEVRLADLIVHVIDGASPIVDEQVRAVKDVLAEIGAQDVPMLEAVNKMDIISGEAMEGLRERYPDAVFISAGRPAGMPELLRRIRAELRQELRICRMRIPQAKSQDISRLFSCANILSREYGAEYVDFEVEISDDAARAFADYING